MKKTILILLSAVFAFTAVSAQENDKMVSMGEVTVNGYAPAAVPNVNEEPASGEAPVAGYGLNGQKKVTGDVVFEHVEEMPEYPGGQAALMQYLNQNIKYPAKALKKGKQGRVVVQFIVEKSGAPSHFKILRGVDPDLDAEALRVVKNMKKFKPGKNNGKPVRVRYALPIMFRLQ